ncbi:MAG: type IV pilus secretin PilQ [Tepidimonas sp.]|nr:type IV pilus secretin PilQ [Tepidimonas sp.]
MNERDGFCGGRAAQPASRQGLRYEVGALAAGLLLMLAPAAEAQEAIRAISASVVGGSEVVRIETAAPLPGVPAGFATPTPPRIALDFPATRNATGKSSLEVNQGNLRSVNVIEAGERTRVVLNLVRNVPYEARAEGNVLLVTLQPPAATSPAAAPTLAGTGPAAGNATLADIDFRRGDDAAGRVIVQLGSAQTPVDIRPQGRNVVVEFQRSTLPEGLRRRLDVSDFGTPVRTITATQAGDRVRLLVENAGEWEHSAYQSDTQFVLEVRPVKPDPNKLLPGARYRGEKITLNFQNIDVRALLQVIADFTGFNIIASESVQGTLTLRLKDVPWDQAFDIILESKQLGRKVEGSVIRVAPKKELDEEALAQREVGRKLEELEPLRTEVFRLNFGKAKEVAEVLNQRTVSTEKGAGNRFLSERGSAVADERTNQIFVTDVSSRLEAVREYIRKIDAPKRQVMIQARIVEAREGFSRSLGIRLGGADLRAIRGGDAGYSLGGGARVAVGASYDAITSTSGQTGNLMNNANTSFVNLPAKASAGADVPRIALALFSPAANRYLNLELSALESDNQGRVVSSPKVVTGDLSKAVIKQGDQLRFIRRRTNAQGQIEDVVDVVDANLQLQVEPQITPSGQVLMKIKATKNRLVGITDAGPQLDVKEVETEVMVDNGGTVMIGGIFEQDEINDVNKVPVLGDVPVLGNLFKNRSTSLAKKETLVFVTPVVVDEVIYQR